MHEPRALGVLMAVAMLYAALAGTTADHGRESTTPTWAGHLRQTEEALAFGDGTAAVTAWRAAQDVALRGPGWEPMIEIGNAHTWFLDLAEAGDAPEAAVADLARSAYQVALARARQQGSLEGVLLAAEGFDQLGDAAAVRHCLLIAQRLAAHDPEGRTEVAAAAARLSTRPITDLDIDP